MSGLTHSTGSGLCSISLLNLTKSIGSGYTATTQAALPGLKVSFPSLVSIIVPATSGLCGTDQIYYHQ